jgi:hypothetical protein
MDTYKWIEPKAAQLRDQAAAAQSRFGAGNVYLAYREECLHSVEDTKCVHLQALG